MQPAATPPPSPLAHPAVRGPLRRYRVTTLGAGLMSAVAAGGVLALRRDPGYVRESLEARMWGMEDLSPADVAAGVTPAWGVPVGVVGVLAFTALLWWGATRPVRATRWVGTVAAVLGLLTALSWMVDGPAMVRQGAGGAAVLLACLAMAVVLAVWLLGAHRKAVREAFEG